MSAGISKDIWRVWLDFEAWACDSCLCWGVAAARCELGRSGKRRPSAERWTRIELKHWAMQGLFRHSGSCLPKHDPKDS